MGENLRRMPEYNPIMATMVSTTIRKLGRRPARGVVLESRLLDRRLRHHPQNYIFQSALCMLALLAIILVVDVDSTTAIARLRKLDKKLKKRGDGLQVQDRVISPKRSLRRSL